MTNSDRGKKEIKVEGLRETAIGKGERQSNIFCPSTGCRFMCKKVTLLLRSQCHVILHSTIF
jgi:hypothetical protein